MRTEQVNVHQRALRAAERIDSDSGRLQEIKHGEPESEPFWKRFLPYGRSMHMIQDAKGVFVPYPLLGIIVTLAIVVVGGIIAIQVQVSNLSTTILLRDADQRAAIADLKEKTEELQVYILNDREKLIRLQADIDHRNNPTGKRR